VLNLIVWVATWPEGCTGERAATGRVWLLACYFLREIPTQVVEWLTKFVHCLLQPSRGVASNDLEVMISVASPVALGMVWLRWLQHKLSLPMPEESMYCTIWSDIRCGVLVAAPHMEGLGFVR